jgi:hypothetical protein
MVATMWVLVVLLALGCGPKIETGRCTLSSGTVF